MKTRTISIKELTSTTYSLKDNSPRGVKTIRKDDVKIGDYIVIDNYFTLVIE